MIGKQTKKAGFKDTLKYVLSKDTAQVVSTNMIGQNVDELTREFKLSEVLRPNLKKKVYHASLSLPEGERLSNEQWALVTQKYLNQMDFKGSQYVSVIHEDTNHQHIHIVASRVRLDGSVVSDSQDYKRSEKAIRTIEKEFGLTRVANSYDVDRKAPTTGELRKAIRLNESSTRAQLQSLIDKATTDKPSMSEFVSRLQESGVQIQANISKTNYISGISFILNGEKMKGSDLGRRYTWQGLIKQGVTYEQNRDFQKINRARDRAIYEGGKRDRQSDYTRRREKLQKLLVVYFSQSRKSQQKPDNIFQQLAEFDSDIRELLGTDYYKFGDLSEEAREHRPRRAKKQGLEALIAILLNDSDRRSDRPDSYNPQKQHNLLSRRKVGAVSRSNLPSVERRSSGKDRFNVESAQEVKKYQKEKSKDDDFDLDIDF